MLIQVARGQHLENHYGSLTCKIGKPEDIKRVTWITCHVWTEANSILGFLSMTPCPTLQAIVLPLFTSDLNIVIIFILLISND